LIKRQEWDFELLMDEFARRLIYFVGNARGGSTFGNAAVATHPHLLEVRWNDRTFGELWPKRKTASDEEWRRLLLRSPGYYNEAKAIKVLGDRGMKHFREYVSDLCKTRRLRDMLCFPGMLFWLMRDAEPSLESLKGWCFKSNTWRGLDRVTKVIPQLKVIIIQRDPRSTALSMAKAIARRSTLRFTNAELGKAALDWLRNATEFADFLGRHKDRATAFKYEDLIERPARTLNQVYSFLGLPLLSATEIGEALQLVPYSRTQTGKKKEMSKDAGKETARGIRTESLERWRLELSPEQLGIVTSLTASGAGKFEYRWDEEQRRVGMLRTFSMFPPTLRAKELLRFLYCQHKLAHSGAINLIRA
jgi:hypothetical protein